MERMATALERIATALERQAANDPLVLLGAALGAAPHETDADTATPDVLRLPLFDSGDTLIAQRERGGYFLMVESRNGQRSIVR